MPDAASLAHPVRIAIARAGEIDPTAFAFPCGRARFAVAFVSPFLDFAATAAALSAAAHPTQLVAVPTAGELVGGDGPLYRPLDADHADAVLEIFPPDLIDAVAVSVITSYSIHYTKLYEHWLPAPARRPLFRRVRPGLPEYDSPSPSDAGRLRVP